MMQSRLRNWGALATSAAVLALASAPAPAQNAAASAAPAARPAALQTGKATPAKLLFGAAKSPAPLAARSIGSYSRGCLAGGRALPVDGPAWQAMRLSRNRNWGHPRLVDFLERLAKDAQKHDGWPGLLVGDMAQPRGGPMLTGHASHQIGLDADIWLTPMPKRTLTRTEREKQSAVSMLAADKLSVNPYRWTVARARIIKRAAASPEVARIFVHPAIKKAMCAAADAGTFGKDRSWLGKVRPWWGHHYHFHIRLDCPKGSAGCKPQPPAPADDGCGAELAGWYKRLTAPPKPPGKPRPPKPPMTLDRLPDACRVVLSAGQNSDGSQSGSGSETVSTAGTAGVTPGQRLRGPVRAVKRGPNKASNPAAGAPGTDLPEVFRQ